jgi:hypothetical protein
MKTISKPVYYCDYCNKLGLSKSGMARHEQICNKNPENARPCYSCKFCVKRETTVETMYYGLLSNKHVELFYCEHHCNYIHTPQNAIRGNQYDTDEPNIGMPKECKDHKEHENETSFSHDSIF